MDNNVIKTNQGFHVQEDFYEALINGLQCERDKEKFDEEDNGGKILSSKQQRYLRRVTAPLILSEMTKGGLLGEYMSFRYNSHKTKKILEYQRKAYVFLKFYQEQDENLTEVEEEQESEAKRLSFMEMYKMYRTLRRMWSLYDLYKSITSKTSQVERREFKFDEYDLRNPVEYEKMKSDLTVHLLGNQSYIVNIMEIIMSEVAIALIRSADRAFERINMAIYTKIGLMVAQAIAEQVAWHLIGGILEATGIGFVMHAAGAVRAAAWARKIGNFIGGLKSVATTVQNLNKGNRVLRAANAFQRFNSSMLARGLTKLTYGAARAGIQAYNIVTISNQELAEIERLITEEVKRSTAGVQDRLSGRVEMLSHTEVNLNDSFSQIGNRLRDRIDMMSLSQTDYSFISQKYNRDITIRGVDDSKFVTTLSQLDVFFQNFWRRMNYDDFENTLKATYEKVKMTDVGFSSDSFEIFFSKSFDDAPEKPIWWNTNRHYWMHKFMQIKVNSGDFDMYYLGISGGFSAYFMKNGNLIAAFESKHERVDYSGSRVVFRSENKQNFERIYIDGIESGFKLKFDKANFQPGIGTNYGDYNLKDEKDENGNPKWKIANPPEGVKVSFTEDGRLLINMSELMVKPQKEGVSVITNFYTGQENELKAEKTLNNHLKEIQKIIEEKLAFQDQEQLQLREEASRLVQQYNSVTASKSVARAGITPGSMYVDYETVSVQNYDAQRWNNIINNMSSTQLKALIERLNQIQGDNLRKLQEITKLNQIMYEGR